MSDIAVAPVTVSVVIPVRDGADLLDQQLARVAGQHSDRSLEIIVADNGSRDHVPDVVARWAEVDPRVRRVDAAERRGPGAARNIGADHASGSFLLFCDADDLVQSGWIDALADALADADIVAGYLDFTSLKPGPTPMPARNPTPHQFGYLPAGLGANLGVRADHFDKAGGFDESLLVGEDLDLCWRLQEAGARFATVADAVVTKRERDEARARMLQALAYGRGDPALYARHRGQGMPRQLGLTVKTWGWLFCNSWFLLIGPRRRYWLYAVALRIGRLQGCLRNRVFYP